MTSCNLVFVRPDSKPTLVILMNDTDVIKKAYEQLMQQIFDAYWNDAFVAKPASNQIQRAETKFRDGITRARQARDRAIALLPP